MNIEGLATHSIRSHPQSEKILRIIQAALKAVDPMEAIRLHMNRQGSELSVNQHENENCYTIDLNQVRRIRLVAFGKAAIPMACATAEILDYYLTDGIVITKAGYIGKNSDPSPWNSDAYTDMCQTLDERFTIIEAGHPVPDEHSLLAGQQVQAFLAGGQPDDLILVLISGGGSALLVLPAPDISLPDIQSMTNLLLACGSSIHQINALRKHIDFIKGGGLARLAAPAQVISMILSDVVGDPLDVIASGPTVPDPSTFGEALQILERQALPYLKESAVKHYALPRTIPEYLSQGASGKIAETPKPGDPLFDKVNNFLVGSNPQAASAALQQAQAEGFHSLLLTTYLQGEARQAGKFFASILRQVAVGDQPLPRPACLIAGGETTVTLNPTAQQAGNSLGGRNQELALGAVADLDGLEDIVLISLATDGGDGPTDAAGAVATGKTLTRAKAMGLDLEDHLWHNDSYHYFEMLNDLLKPGPTLTNVNDLIFMFAL